MTFSTSRTWLGFAVRSCAVLSVLLVAGHAQARVSLASIDAKLDSLVAASGAVNPGDIVALRNNFGGTSQCSSSFQFGPLTRIAPTGVQSADEFEVPAGKMLLVTHVAWQAVDGFTNFVVDRALTMRLFVQEGTGPINSVYRSENVQITNANDFNRLGTHENISPGIPVAAGHHLCASANNSTQSSSGLNQVSEIYVRGVLIPLAP